MTSRYKITHNFRHTDFMAYLKDNVRTQIHKELKNREYDVRTLGLMIDQGQFDKYGKLTIKGMRKERKMYELYGCDILA